MTHYDSLRDWDAYATDWASQTFNTAYQWTWLSRFIKKPYKVLELGCGDGRWASYFDDYTGSDISPNMLAIAKERNPGATFGHHDMRQSVTGDWGLIFTFTSWLHISGEEIKKVQLPDCDYLFVEPHGKGDDFHCFQHNYPKLFGVKPLAKHGKLTVYGKFKGEQ